MGQPVVHFEIGGTKSNELREFYRKAFDWKIQMHEEMQYGLVSPEGDGSIGGGIGQSPEHTGPYVTFYIQSKDLDVDLKRIESFGGKTVLKPTPIPGTGSMALFADPEGNTLGLFKPGA